MYDSTDLTIDQCHALFEKLNNHSGKNTVPPILGLLGERVATLKYLGRNRVQTELAESRGVSQSTISRAITAVITLLIDGAILPCVDWANQPDPYSVKHHRSGVNIQVITDTRGRLHWISSPLPGSTHDILTHLDPTKIIADKVYIGRGLTTPVRTPTRGHLTLDDEEHNRNINHIRWPIERANAHLKTWRTLSTIHRHPYTTFKTAIKAIPGIIIHTPSITLRRMRVMLVVRAVFLTAGRSGAGGCGAPESRPLGIPSQLYFIPAPQCRLPTTTAFAVTSDNRCLLPRVWMDLTVRLSQKGSIRAF